MNMIQYFVIFDSPKAHPTITESGFGSDKDKGIAGLSADVLSLGLKTLVLKNLGSQNLSSHFDPRASTFRRIVLFPQTVHFPFLRHSNFTTFSKSEYKNENISNEVFPHQKGKELEKNLSKYIPNF